MYTSWTGTLLHIALPALAAGFFAGCSGGSGEGLDSTTPPASFNPVFSEIQTNVFTPTCATAGCHAGAGAPQGLRLDAANSYALLVNVPSSEVPSLLRVAPGDPDGSYLIQKLEGTAAVGERMPLGRQPLAQATIDVIRQWITDGAMDDSAPSTEPVRVSSLSPVPDSNLDSAPAELVAMFDRELDISTVNVNTFVLEASGGDGTFDDGNEEQISAAAITTSDSGMSAAFDLDGVALADDTYRVRLLGSGPSIIMDLDANALDGDFSGTFPSGDGVEGGDFEADFTITEASSTGSTPNPVQANVTDGTER